MAVEYKNGSMGKTKPFPEALGEFVSACEKGTAKALHVGTEQEVESVKEKKDLQSQIGELADAVSELKARSNSGLIKFPSIQEIREVLVGRC